MTFHDHKENLVVLRNWAKHSVTDYGISDGTKMSSVEFCGEKKKWRFYLANVY